MMKRSKVVSRNADLQRERTPLRKMHPSRKSALHHSSQSIRSSHTSIQRSSSSMKRQVLGTKRMRSPAAQSPSPSERRGRNHSNDSSAPSRHLPHKKTYDLIKKRPPHSPVGHGLSSREILIRSATPPPNRYQRGKGRESDQCFDSSPKKKLHRAAENSDSDHSPPQIPISRRSTHQCSGSLNSHRDGPRCRLGPLHPASSDFGLSHSSERPRSSDFHAQGSDHHDEYFHGSTLEKLRHVDEPRLYPSEKHYGQTSDQHFSSDSSHAVMPRIRYSRSDLEKITIDIRPAVRDSSPTVRRIINPDNVKLVRRPSEGKKPIFDREEIKQAPRDMREDAHYEHRSVSTSVTSSVTHYGMTRRELENYEITRHKFDSFHGSSSSSEMRTLNDRWQKLDSKKLEPSHFDRDERTQLYPDKLRHSDDDRPSISRSYDRDYRGDKYTQDREPPYHADDYPDSHHSLSSNPLDLRHSLTVRREDVSNSRHRLQSRKYDESRPHWSSMPKSIMDNGSDKLRGKRSASRVSQPLSPRRNYKPEGCRRNSQEEKLPGYTKRYERFKYPSWSQKPDGCSRNPNYFEQEELYSSEISNFRSPGRLPPGRLFRSRPYRGGIRGGTRGRGMFRGGSSSRGLGYSTCMK